MPAGLYIERYRPLLLEAEARFAALRLSNITARVGDGFKGWREQAPFERIIVTAAARDVPGDLADQLAEGGVMVLPVGRQGRDQNLLRLIRTADGVVEEPLGDVRFVPLLGGLPDDPRTRAASGVASGAATAFTGPAVERR